MTRRIVYGISLWVYLGAVACTIAAIALPNWISYTSPTDNDPIRVSYGLHKRCSSITGQCTPFPQDQDCHGDDRSFCSMWRSTGFLMNFGVIFEVAILVAYVVILVGGRGTREIGWKILSPMIMVVAAAQLVAMTLVAYLYDHDNRFFVGWALDKSWILCTVSWIVMLFDAVGVVSASFLLPPEDDYEAIPEPY
ncbi:hypothetical protein WHR41_07126 [Cladosporium halotolerans]|uniref:Uncharacterized protein n=1 Tax=Cladosporium halotolerans TaxID=1052096 RepID=A0AB34KGB0_9PEZI